MSWKKARAMEDAMYGWPSAMKWAYFKKMSTTVSMTLLPCTLGSASTKSMDIIKPDTGRHRRQLKETGGVQNLDLVPLASGAIADVVADGAPVVLKEEIGA
jgi:hypothetical protein